MHQTATAAAAAVTRNSTTMHSTDTNNRNIEDHEDQASLISALSGEDVDVSLLAGENVAYHDDDDDEAGCTLISNTSSNASNYFMTPHHKHADSLCYSSTSSPPPGSRKKGVPTSSYLASFGNSLGSQQAFPSSMFPGQKLLPPNSSKDPLGHEGAKDDSRRSHSNVPSYYYMSPPFSSEIPPNAASSSWQESYQNSGSGAFRHVDTRSTIARFNSIQVSGSNVYQKRSTRSEFYDDDVSLPANWRAAMNCLFSPRVLATLLICAVILVNLLRVGNQGKHHRNHGSSTLRGSHVSADYVKLEAIGNTELWSLFDDDGDESPPPIDEKAFNKPRADHEEGGKGT